VFVYFFNPKETPFSRLKNEEIQQSIRFNEPCKFEKSLKQDWKDLILSMLHKDPLLRPTIEQLCNHSLFKTTKQLLIEKGVVLEKNIFEVTELGGDQRKMYDQFKHIYFVQNDFREVATIPVFNINEAIVVLIPHSVKTIPNEYFGVFYFDEKLFPQLFSSSFETFFIFSDIEEIGDYCFSRSINLQEVLFPPFLKKIGKNCFPFCTSVNQINIPKSVIEIGNECFYLSNIFQKGNAISTEKNQNLI
jgi:serine/threonine protein kinase